MAKDINGALEALRSTGPLTPSRVVEAAEDPESPLHSKFTWEDEKAAHEYRLIQARRLIVNVKFTPTGSERSLSVFIHVPSRYGEGEYVPVNVLARQPEAWALARQEVLKHLEAAQENLTDLDESIRLFGPTGGRTTRASRSITRARHEIEAIEAK